MSIGPPTRLIEATLGRLPRRLTRLSGGCVGEVYLAEFDAGLEPLVIKLDRSEQPSLRREAFMLRLLRDLSTLPVPRVIASDDRLLAMEYIESGSTPGERGLVELAEAVARLHGIHDRTFGLDEDTLIGPLPLPNQRSESWPMFFGEQRVRHFARQAHRAGRLTTELLRRCERLADHMGEVIDCTEPPCLVHGDLWAGNVLWHRGRLAGVIDPACYFADREVELAFMDLFGSFGPAFWDRYHEIRPIRPGFWQRRRHAYRIFPLLVHVHLFGGTYSAQLQCELEAVGF
ncbi:MAG: fructosamine kinase family protein [Phycisphaerales bacterium]